ncbi:MAG: hypothetical protein WAM92_20145 [Mycobacterium sp.]
MTIDRAIRKRLVGHMAQWVPPPRGRFYLAMRIYWPESEALDGTWEPPPVLRI